MNPIGVYSSSGSAVSSAAFGYSAVMSYSPPTTSDIASTAGLFRAGQVWIDLSTSFVYMLTSLGASQGVVSANWVLISSSGGALNTLTGNSGGPIGPSAGNIDILGNNLFTVVGAANSLTLTPESSAYPITPFVVGPVGQAGYQTIQSAINAAALTATSSAPNTVFIQPGQYTENLTMTNFVNLVALPQDMAGASVYIIGNATYANTDPAGFGAFSGLVFISPNASPAFDMQDSMGGTSNTSFLGCRFGGPGQGSGTNLKFGVGKNLTLTQCVIHAPNGAKNFDGTSGMIFCSNSVIESGDTPSTLDNAGILVQSSQCSDSFSLNNAAAFYALFSLVGSNGASDAIATCKLNCSVFLVQSVIIAASLYIVDGNGPADSGSVVYSSLSCLGSSTFDPDLTLTPIVAIP